MAKSEGPGRAEHRRTIKRLPITEYPLKTCEAVLESNHRRSGVTPKKERRPVRAEARAQTGIGKPADSVPVGESDGDEQKRAAGRGC